MFLTGQSKNIFFNVYQLQYNLWVKECDNRLSVFINICCIMYTVCRSALLVLLKNAFRRRQGRSLVWKRLTWNGILDVLPYCVALQGRICLFLVIFGLKSKKYCVACVLIVPQCSIYRGRDSEKDKVLLLAVVEFSTDASTVMAASPPSFSLLLNVLPNAATGSSFVSASHFLLGKNQFLLSGRNLIWNSFLAARFFSSRPMPPDRYPQILFSNSFVSSQWSPKTMLQDIWWSSSPELIYFCS